MGNSSTNMNDLKTDMSEAVSAITRGQDRFELFEEIAARHPRRTREIRQVLLFTPVSRRVDAVKEALFGGGR
jgi:hypothetical protein